MQSRRQEEKHLECDILARHIASNNNKVCVLMVLSFWWYQRQRFAFMGLNCMRGICFTMAAANERRRWCLKAFQSVEDARGRYSMFEVDMIRTNKSKDHGPRPRAPGALDLQNLGMIFDHVFTSPNIGSPLIAFPSEGCALTKYIPSTFQEYWHTPKEERSWLSEMPEANEIQVPGLCLCLAVRQVRN